MMRVTRRQKRESAARRDIRAQQRAAPQAPKEVQTVDKRADARRRHVAAQNHVAAAAPGRQRHAFDVTMPFAAYSTCFYTLFISNRDGDGTAMRCCHWRVSFNEHTSAYASAAALIAAITPRRAEGVPTRLSDMQARQAQCRRPDARGTAALRCDAEQPSAPLRNEGETPRRQPLRRRDAARHEPRCC